MRLVLLPALMAAVAAAAPADAADEGDVRVATVGLGVQNLPRYPGADHRRTGPLLLFDLSRPGDPIRFKAPDQGIGFGFLGRRSMFDFGPAVRWNYARRAGRDVPAGMPGVGYSFEAGAFVQATFADAVRLRAEGRKGIGGHKGAVLDLSADAIVRDKDDGTLFSIGPRLRLSDSRYQRAYFGVTPGAAAATGLAAYNPSGGAHAVGLWSGLTHRFGPRWGAYLYGGYDRLIGHADTSPLVRRYGKRDQVSGGVALTYSFRVRVPRL